MQKIRNALPAHLSSSSSPTQQVGTVGWSPGLLREAEGCLRKEEIFIQSLHHSYSLSPLPLPSLPSFSSSSQIYIKKLRGERSYARFQEEIQKSEQDIISVPKNTQSGWEAAKTVITDSRFGVRKTEFQSCFFIFWLQVLGQILYPCYVFSAVRWSK